MRIPVAPPELTLDALAERDKLALMLAVGATHGGSYLHWDDLRFRTPPEGLTVEEWWTAHKLARTQQAKYLGYLDKEGQPFWFVLADPMLEVLHLIDRDLAGHVGSAERLAGPGQRDRYRFSSLVEEAITSSQLEGAAVTRRVAKEMIRTGRAPRDVSERMVYNNYRAMQRIRELRSEPLTPELVLELHRIVTDGTLDHPADAGRIQQPGERRVFVSDELDGTAYHFPPDAEELPSRLQAMCEFANGDSDDGFIHPVIRAVILHFWLAYDHPFVDGNGRVARSVFYWSMLSQGYWLAEFISISSVLRKAPAQYGRSFLLTETDESDLTYFVVHQLTVLRKAVDELYRYLERKSDDLVRTEALVRNGTAYNHRQVAVLSHALRHPDQVYTIAGHAASHGVVYQTARTDLLDLADRGLLKAARRGRRYEFTAVPDLERVVGTADR